MASPLQGVPHIAAFDQLAQERFSLIHLENILVNMFDTVDVSLLDTLAEQYDLLGYKGWILATNEAEKRNLLKGAIQLKRLAGTPDGIREVIKRLGFLDVVIEEGWENFTDGSDEPDVAPWAYFRVVYALPGDKAITEEIANNLVGLIQEYKPVRSHLANFSFSIPQEDTSLMSGEVTLNIYDAATNDLISTEVIPNTIKQLGLSFLLRSLIPVTDTVETTFPRYRIGGISFGTSGTANTGGMGGSPTTITGGFAKDLDDNPDGPFTGPDQIRNRAEIITGDSLFDRMRIKVFFSMAAGEGNGTTYRELGLIIKDVAFDTGDYLLARITRAPLVKTSAIKISGFWEISFFPNYLPSA